MNTQTARVVTNSPPEEKLPRGFKWLQVADIRRETRDAVSIRFAVPDEHAEHYDFTPGQYLTLRMEIDGESLRRPYSLCVEPASGELRICTKQIPDGRMSSYLNRKLQVGDWLPVMKPIGHFFGEPDGRDKHDYVAIAGGSGITPMMSILQHTLSTEPASTILLLYGNRSTEDIIFRETLHDLKNRYLGRLQIVHILSEEHTDVPLLQGLLDSEKVEALVGGLCEPGNIDRFFICGPGPMMDGAEAALQRLGVDADRVRVESFGSRTSAAAGAVRVDDKAPAAEAQVRIGGNTVTVRVPYESSVLDAALAARLDLPYACKGGVCCTCKARLSAGTVEMAVNYGLEPDEIERGYILTCQARPTSDKLEIDYDV